jgi:hypothetical protein
MIFVSVLSLGRKHILQAHLFTIISPAPKADDQDAKLNLLIKAQLGFSFNILQGAVDRFILAIRIDGP